MTITEGDERGLAAPGAACTFCTLRERETCLVTNPTSTVVPSLSAFIPGWLLVVPQVHAHSLAELKGDDAIAFDADVERVVASVSSVFSTPTLFEHGSAGAARMAGCGIDHAHLHVVPTSLQNLHEASATLNEATARIEWCEMPAPWAEEADVPTDEDYLWVRELDGRSWLGKHSSIQSQVFRQVLAMHHGVSTWNWRDDLREATYESTRERLSATLSM